MSQKTPKKEKNIKRKIKTSLWNLLRAYRGWIIWLVVLSLLSNGLNLWLPLIISKAIDAYTNGNLVIKNSIIEFSVASVLILVFFYLQSVVQTYASERVARDLRKELSAKISRQTFGLVEKITPAKLLTNLTVDIDSVKMFVAQAIASIVSSLFTIIGASVLLFRIDWELALAVLTIIPIIGGTFWLVFSRVRALFLKARAVIDRLNKIINESILGSALIRVINAQQVEYNKFLEINTTAQDLGMQILRLFAIMIPIISFIANMAVLIILVLGGQFVINGSISLGDFTAFNSYIALLIFPILIIGFMSNIIAQATASYERIAEVLNTKEVKETGTIIAELKGDIELKDVTVIYGQKSVLKNTSFVLRGGTRNAIIGPTAAGKTQLLYLLTGLIRPTSGVVEYDHRNIDDYEKNNLHNQIGFVFQDSIIFNLTLRENIAFNNAVTEESLQKAIETAELRDFIDKLPDKLATVVSERGASLSGGQKQRIMLARALAFQPKILLLDDFTARVDSRTERKILQNIARNYPGITILSVTQKIASVEHYDKIILLMEGEVLAEGKHEQLLKKSPEYVQIFNSQQSTNQYELQS